MIYFPLFRNYPNYYKPPHPPHYPPPRITPINCPKVPSPPERSYPSSPVSMKSHKTSTQKNNPCHCVNSHYNTKGYSNSSVNSKAKNTTCNSSSEEKPIFDFLGLKLYNDDLLLLSLLFFLYKEDVKDPSLFISLILLLLS